MKHLTSLSCGPLISAVGCAALLTLACAGASDDAPTQMAETAEKRPQATESAGSTDGADGGSVDTEPPSEAEPQNDPEPKDQDAEPEDAPSVACADDIDADQDGLSLCEEAGLGTSDALVDSDADGFDDAEEAKTWEDAKNSAGGEWDPAVGHPAVADVPRIEIELVSAPILAVAEFDDAQDGADRSETKWFGVTELSTASGERGEETASIVHFHQPIGNVSRAIEASYLQGALALNLDLNALSYSFSTTIHNQELAVWSPQRLSDHAHALEWISTTHRTAGAVAIAVEIRNTGARSVDLSDMALSVAAWTPLAPDSNHELVRLSAELAGDAALASFVGQQLGESEGTTQLEPGENLERMVFSASASEEVMSSLLRESFGLSVTPRVASSGKGWMESDELLERTAEVILDLGDDGQTKAFRVAVEPGTSITASAMFERLGVAFETGHLPLDQGSGSQLGRGLVLTSIDSVGSGSDGSAYLVALTREARSDAARTEVMTPWGAGYDFAAIPIAAGDVLQIVRVIDADGDGLCNRTELALTSSDDALDSDGDGLDDVGELLGWTLEDGSATRLVFSHPGIVDFDADGVDDWGERFRATDPMTPLRVDQPRSSWMLADAAPSPH